MKQVLIGLASTMIEIGLFVCDTASLQIPSALSALWAGDTLSGDVHSEAYAIVMSVPFQ